MGDHNWDIWFTKLGKGLGLTLGSTACLYTAGYIEINPVPPEYAFWGGLLIIGLQQIGNWIKHTYLSD